MRTVVLAHQGPCLWYQHEEANAGGWQVPGQPEIHSVWDTVSKINKKKKHHWVSLNNFNTLCARLCGGMQHVPQWVCEDLRTAFCSQFSLFRVDSRSHQLWQQTLSPSESAGMEIQIQNRIKERNLVSQKEKRIKKKNFRNRLWQQGLMQSGFIF